MTTTDPRKIAEALGEQDRECIARVIASAMGDNFSDAFENKQRWIAQRGISGGRFRDVNEPFQADYLDAADAAFNAVRAILEKEKNDG